MSTTDEGAHLHEYDNMYEVGSANTNGCFKNSSEEGLIKLWMKLKLSASSLVDEGEWEDASQHNKDCPICFYPMDDKDTLKMICCQNSLCKICNELVKDRQSKGLLQNGCIFATTSNFGCSNCK